MPINHKPVHVRGHVRAGTRVSQYWRSLPTTSMGSSSSGSFGGLGLIGAFLGFLLVLGFLPFLLLYIAISVYRDSRSKNNTQTINYPASSTAFSTNQRITQPLASAYAVPTATLAPKTVQPIPYVSASLSAWVRFFLAWTLMTSMGWAAAAVLPIIVQAYANTPLAWVGLTVGIGLVVGLAQWVALKGAFPQARYWISATAIGFLLAGIGTVAGTVASLAGSIIVSLQGKGFDIWGIVIPGLFTGGVFLGVTQRLALTKIPTAGWWLFIAPIALCFGGAAYLWLLGVLPGTIGAQTDWSVIKSALFDHRLAAVGAATAAGATNGALSAIPLFWILRHQTSASPESESQ